MVFLENYSFKRLPKQAGDLSVLVRNQPEDIPEIFSGAAERYGSFPKAVKNVARIIRNKELDAYVIRDRQTRTARGIATIIFDQKVAHPTNDALIGNDLDYWMGSEATVGDHLNAAKALIRLSAKATLLSRGINPEEPLDDADLQIKNQAFATTISGQDYNRGFHQFMEAVGKPAELSANPVGDPYDVARSGHVVQLYSYSAAAYDDLRA